MAVEDNVFFVWELDTNGSCPDASGNGNTGTITGASYSSSGKIDGCYSFPTLATYITSDTDISSSGSYSRGGCAWVKLTGTLTAANCIMEPGYLSSGQTGSGWQFEMRDQDGGLIMVNTRSGSAVMHFSTVGNLADGNWHFVGYSFEGTVDSDINFYIDGVWYGTLDVSSGVVINSFVNKPPAIGTRANHSRPFDGLIDQVIIWVGRAPTEADFDQIYNGGSGDTWANIIGGGTPPSTPTDNSLFFGNNF